MFAWLKERVINKMEGLKGNLLNQAGKEVLVKPVIQAIPSYTMSIVRLSKTFCSSLFADVTRFWWSSNSKHRDIHWKSRYFIFSPKCYVGLGFKYFEAMNFALLSK